MSNMQTKITGFASRRIHFAVLRQQELEHALACIRNANRHGSNVDQSAIDELSCCAETAKRDVIALQQAVERVNWRAAKRRKKVSAAR